MVPICDEIASKNDVGAAGTGGALARRNFFLPLRSDFVRSTGTLVVLLSLAAELASGQTADTARRDKTFLTRHATESVVLASLASQVIRGPLGRARPYAVGDTNQYDFSFFAGFRRKEE